MPRPKPLATSSDVITYFATAPIAEVKLTLEHAKALLAGRTKLVPMTIISTEKESQ